MAIAACPGCALPKGVRPMHLAAMKNRVDCVVELMNHGADFNVCDENHHTPLYILAQSGHEAGVLAMLDNTCGRTILSLPTLDSGE